VSGLEDLSRVFDGLDTFNEDLDRWDVSSATNMRGMFFGAERFNADITTWNTGNGEYDEYFLFSASQRNCTAHRFIRLFSD